VGWWGVKCGWGGSYCGLGGGGGGVGGVGGWKGLAGGWVHGRHEGRWSVKKVKLKETITFSDMDGVRVRQRGEWDVP